MGRRSPYWGLFKQYGNQYGVDPWLLANMARAESGFNPNAQSGAGAQGLMQFMPSTFRSMGVGNNPYNVRQSIEAGAKYMSQLMRQFGGDTRLALAGYNAGGGNARHAINAFPETRNYVSKIMGWYGGGNGMPLAGSVGDSQRFSGAPNSIGPTGLSEEQKRLLAAPTSFGATPWNTGLMQSPLIAQLQGAFQQQAAGGAGGMAATTGAAGSGGTAFDTGIGKYRGNVGFIPRRQGETGQQYLDRVARQFGLQHDPGNRQTTGGQHAPNSYHYRGQAVDYGTGRNDMNILNQWYRYLNQYRKQMGLAELLWEDPGTSNSHVHAATSRMGGYK